LTRRFWDESFTLRLGWVLDRSIEQSRDWNARFGEQLAIFWLSMQKIYFTLFATVIFVLFNFFIATIISDNKNCIEKTALSITLIFSIWPGMELFFWGTANAEYMQPLVLLLACIYMYRSEAAIARITSSLLLVVSMSIIAFLAGASFENAPVAVIIYMSLAVVFKEQRATYLRTVAPILSMGAGWLFLITAPSTTHRRLYYNGVFGVDSYSIDYWPSRFADVIRVFFSTASPLMIAFLISFSYLIIKHEYRKDLLLLVVAISLVIVSVIAAPYTEPRSFSLAWALILSVSLAGLFDFLSKQKFFQSTWVIASIVLLYFPLKTYFIYSDFAQKINARDLLISEQTKNGNCDKGVVVSHLFESYPYRYLNNRDEWYKSNPEFVSKYYNCKILIH